jgi:hypothetical protein
MSSSCSCRLCGAISRWIFAQPVLERSVDYFDCPACGYVQTETPSWLEDAYASVIDDLDTGIMWRNMRNAAHVVLTLAAFGALRRPVLDYAGGYGILVRLLRDAGVEAHWTDKYCDNLLARGFEQGVLPYALVTAFEVFEHLEHPLSELRGMLDIAPSVLLSTDLIRSTDAPAPGWWYYGQEHGQHIGFFRVRTLACMAERLGCSYRTDGRTLHVFSRDPIPAYWAPLQRARWLAKVVQRLRLKAKVLSDYESLRARRSGAGSTGPSNAA